MHQTLRLNFPDKLDEGISDFLQKAWHKSETLDALCIVAAEWTPIVMMGVIAVLSTDFGLLPNLAREVLLRSYVAVVAAVGVRLLNEPISKWANRKRPFESRLGSSLAHHESGEAFPSNHASGAFALAMSFVGIPSYFPVLLTLACLVCVSRVYTGLHHTSDVVAGILHGTFSALSCLLILHTVLPASAW